MKDLQKLVVRWLRRAPGGWPGAQPRSVIGWRFSFKLAGRSLAVSVRGAPRETRGAAAGGSVVRSRAPWRLASRRMAWLPLTGVVPSIAREEAQWTSGTRSAPTQSNRSKTPSRANHRKHPKKLPTESRPSPRRWRPAEGTRLRRADHRLAGVARRRGGRGDPPFQCPLQELLASSARTRGGLPPKSLLVPARLAEETQRSLGTD
jgi:hypothetical protein